MPRKPIRVSAAVYAGLEAIRQSGLTNICDRPRVIDSADLWEFDETAAWVRTHRREYAELIIAGVDVGEEGGAPCAD